VTIGAVILSAGQGADHDLARRHMPLLRLDACEPYAPLAMGYTVFRTTGPSSSSKFTVTPTGAVSIEYAVWYDWDIQHLYDLEHVWVHLDTQGRVMAVEASFHGQRVPMELAGGLPALQGARPVLYAEPGKHAHWADPAAMETHAGVLIREKCGAEAGLEAVHRGNPFFAAAAYMTTPLSDRLALRKMQRDAFPPSFVFSRSSDDALPELLPWSELAAWIPARMAHLIADLPAQVPHLEAIFLDCGDTLIDEATEVKVEGSEVVLEAAEIPDAMEAVRQLHAMGYPLILVADGPRETFENLLKPRGIWDLLRGHVISGDVGVLKPDRRMFATALRTVGLDEGARARVVMVGNNLSRDIKGANDFGLISLFVGWSKRRSHAPADASEVPNHRIDQLRYLPDTIAAIELGLPEVQA
jgi:phosphoglycolate phosphatase-like HAD superfamily hydrolase